MPELMMWNLKKGGWVGFQVEWQRQGGRSAVPLAGLAKKALLGPRNPTAKYGIRSQLTSGIVSLREVEPHARLS